MTKIVYQLFVFLLLLLFVQRAEAKTFSYRHFSIEDGLPSSEVYDVLQDDNGLMWFATDRGVARFDGYEFEIFNTDNGLPDNVILSLFKDYKGRIWFISYSGQLSYFENEEVKVYPYNSVIKNEIQSPLIISFYVDNLSTVHLGLMDKGYLKIESNGDFELKQQKNGAAFNVALIENQLLYYRFKEQENFEFNQLYFFRNNNLYKSLIPPVNTVENHISHISSINTDGSFYFSIQGNLFFLKNDKIQLIKEFSHRITHISRVGDKLYVGFYRKGFVILIDNVEIYEDPNQNSVSSIFVDNMGGHWITTLDNGIQYSVSNEVITYNQKDGLSSDEIYDIAGNDSTLIISDLSGLVSYSDLSTLEFVLHRSPSNFAKKFLTDTKTQKIYVYFNSYIQEIQDETSHNTKFIFQPYFLLNDNTIFGLKFENGKYQFGYYDFTRFEALRIKNVKNYVGTVKCAILTSQNRLLLGCKDGLREIIPSETSDSIFEFIHLGEKNPLFNSRIIKIVNYPGFDFIAATRGEGVLLVKNNIPFALKEIHGLLSNQITCIFTDEELNIWVGTSAGLSLLNLKNGITNFKVEDGLISNEVTGVYANETKVYVGTKKGLTVLDKKKLIPSKVDVPVLFREIKDENNLLKIKNQTILLNYHEPLLSIQFAGIYYKSMGKIFYRYRMNPNENWQYTSQNNLLISNLASGNYKLEISASNDEVNWSSTPALLNILVEYPIWLKPRFLVPVSIAISFFLIFLYKFSMNRLRHRENLKRQIQNLRFEAISAQMNPHFMFNSLNSIQNFIINSDKKESIRYLSKFAKLMRSTLDNSRKKHITLVEEIESLSIYLDLESLRFDSLIKYKINIAPQINSSEVILPALLIQPIVENSVLHGLRPKNEGGLIQISFNKVGVELIIEIEDDGIGRTNSAKNESSEEHKSAGMDLTKERTQLFALEKGMKSEFEIIDLIHNNKAVGTKVRIKIPYVIDEK